MGHARESRPDADEQTPVQSLDRLVRAEAAVARSGMRPKAVLPEVRIPTPLPQPVPTLPPVTDHAPFSPPSLDTASLILRGEYPRTKVPSVKTIDESFFGRLREGEPFIVGTVAFFGALLLAGIVFLVLALVR